MTPSVMFCTILENTYNDIVFILDTLIQAPIMAMGQLKSQFERMFSITYKSIESALDVLEKQLYLLVDMLTTNISDYKDEWCQIAYVCKPLTNVLFKYDYPLYWLSDEEKEDAKNNYETFNNLVCKNGLSNLIDGYKDMLLVEIEAKLDALKKRLGVSQILDEWIQVYLNSVYDSGIYEYLDKLDEWMDCGFELCTSLETALNKQEDSLDRVSMEKQGNSYVFVVKEWAQQVYDKQDELDTKMRNLDDLIDGLKNDNSQTSWFKSGGKSPDELAKG